MKTHNGDGCPLCSQCQEVLDNDGSCGYCEFQELHDRPAVPTDPSLLMKVPMGRVEDAPKDGSTCLFRVLLDLTAFWCDDAKRWVLSRSLNLEYLPTKADHIPATDPDPAYEARMEGCR